MKTLKISFKVIRWITAILLLLFALATLMGKSYGQAFCVLGIALLLVYWPAIIEKRLKPLYSVLFRIFIIALLFVGMKTVLAPEPKTSIYKSEEDKAALMSIYEELLTPWPAETKSRFVSTPYGRVHYLEYGDPSDPPLVMFHAASLGAHSWAENLEPLLDHFHIYAIDNIGEGNRSELRDALEFPSNPREVADFYSDLLEQLNIDSAVVFGASNGGFIAQSMAFYHSDKVSKLALFGPMGLTQLTSGSIAMMMASTIYPFQFMRDAVAKWALGTSPVCHEKYGSWFNQIMKGTIPSIAHPVPMTTEQKEQMNMPILLFLGTQDRIVGDAEKAKTMAEMYPNIQVEVLNSGHLIAVEHANKVNKTISDFLNK